MIDYYFSIRQFWLIKCSFFIHRTTSYIHPRLIIELSRSFPIAPSQDDSKTRKDTKI